MSLYIVEIDPVGFDREILNDIIKIIVKIGLLLKNNQLNENEIKLCNNFRDSFHYFVIFSQIYDNLFFLNYISN